MQPPTAGTEGNRSLTLFVQFCSDWGAALHALAEKVVEAFAGAALGKEFVARGDNIYRIKLNRDVERIRITANRRSQNNLQRGLGGVCLQARRILMRKLAID